ncbi:MAG TPA: septal ring lytic transglycosylase RlpA family protein [Saprospiraceae bacterium]|nr:septal ring lytic transglycosylase RlpA family protein [Candidatus Parvibacillus calidus]MBX2937605.1 septal ring lytic transglycosylase RlpA family protein [Saprospiraceae bacterium]MBX7179688.1 septal ring lytic transglycosylase RlpA family protein [Saprospiraceae bacterium]MCB0589932.1 septal ring lytic transglycosylase RlpA family protein [Saprospiraceae bacterium]MCO5284438.1 septal ring lytic transglycosylase RlpA family protein [Saprospiraceae bacterium]
MRLFCIIAWLLFSTVMFSQTFVGTATIYSKKFDGKKTYSGQIFDSRKISVAHPWLPMGTKVEVTNLKNNKKLIATINDRMGKSSGYLLDMSEAAAKMIGLTRRHGVTRIKIKVL